MENLSKRVIVQMVPPGERESERQNEMSEKYFRAKMRNVKKIFRYIRNIR